MPWVRIYRWNLDSEGLPGVRDFTAQAQYFGKYSALNPPSARLGETPKPS